MALFDRYIAVDWSAANTPKRGRDSIWIGELGPDGPVESGNAPTRHAAMASIRRRLLAARHRGERIMLGFDFVFGYPRGAAAAIAGTADWRALWEHFARHVEDADDNRSNRFELAATLNGQLAEGPHFWGHPHRQSYAGLGPRRPAAAYLSLPERRLAETWVKSVQPVWKLTGIGSVGSQTLLGIARLAALRADPELSAELAVWPFETDFSAALERPVTVVEIYPSLFPLGADDVLPRDRAQVEAAVRGFAELDARGLLRQFLAAPAGLAAADRALAIAEEGWIAGAGQQALLADLRSAA